MSEEAADAIGDVLWPVLVALALLAAALIVLPGPSPIPTEVIP